ncbi:DUF6137 domain-containing protein [Rugamonas sp. CCM 8940]|uniref:DUF6137 domain-containing protein n=1 Tax=Rugamonas sp. CCM 8940 TaxID=2765359 RepID=UPI0018F6B5A1|nr:DUF6137 domain-containing protein [Rugamonas sp. CCM 8940]MBJ7311493.1 hypothetical protein [Rugamonas sp. CCM 8940]
MTPNFLRQLIIHTICNVTGEEPKDIVALDEVALDTRDWEQIFSRLEAALDIHLGMLTSSQRSISIDALMRMLHAKLSGDIIA